MSYLLIVKCFELCMDLALYKINIILLLLITCIILYVFVVSLLALYVFDKLL